MPSLLGTQGLGNLSARMGFCEIGEPVLREKLMVTPGFETMIQVNPTTRRRGGNISLPVPSDSSEAKAKIALILEISADLNKIQRNYFDAFRHGVLILGQGTDTNFASSNPIIIHFLLYRKFRSKRLLETFQPLQLACPSASTHRRCAELPHGCR